MLKKKPKRYRYPLELISIAIWSYHRFNDSYRGVSERLFARRPENLHTTREKFLFKAENDKLQSAA
ncbi:hypothetical protein [Legionella sainthelensi]|uniref:hypothetical protein n=1 Tax=Legionella sainthelensi TaxID=28087 RepID=UPI001013D32C|nr:hypothetical protein [Legionella sainthelensi]